LANHRATGAVETGLCEMTMLKQKATPLIQLRESEASGPSMTDLLAMEGNPGHRLRPPISRRRQR
jgi:hypothetical protein